MKDFAALRTELNEGTETLVESAPMPPQILILRRVTVRQFPGDTYVALYKNDRLGLTFSIPYGADVRPLITPMTEEVLEESEQLDELNIKTLQSYTGKAIADLHKSTHKALGTDKPYVEKRWLKRAAKRHQGLNLATQFASTPRDLKEEGSVSLKEDDEYLSRSTSRAGKAAQKASWMANFEKHVVKRSPEHAGKIDWHTASHLHATGHEPEAAAHRYTAKDKKLNEGHDPIQTLRGIRDGHASEHVKHNDGTKTRVDHVTAHALLTVHDSLSPENQAKMSGAMSHSKAKFHRIVDFTWKNVK